jgi:phenylacetate-CoA ligase
MLSQIRSNLPAIVWPPMVHGAPAVLGSMMAQLQISEWLAPEEIEARQFGQLESLCRHLAAHSAQFQARLNTAGLVVDDLLYPAGLRALPVLTRRDVQTSADIFCTEVPEGHAPLNEFRTSGSTGEPVVVRRTQANQFDWLAFTLRDHFWRKRDFSQKLCSIRATVTAPTHGPDWGPPVSFLFDSGPSLVIPITSTKIPEQFDLIERFRPDTLLLYPSNLLALLGEREARGAGLESLSHVRSMGETVTPAFRSRLHDTLGLEVEDTYSSQELGYVALQCPGSLGYHVMAESMIVEVLDDEGQPCSPGQIGRVVVTDLHNFATPMIRYEIGDHAEAGGPCACGRGLPTLNRVLGRTRNLILMPDGTRRWPLVVFSRYRDFAPVRQYQMIQIDRMTVEVRLAVDRPMTGAEEADFSAHIQASLGHPFHIHFVIFEGALPRGGAGKFEEFISLV